MTSPIRRACRRARTHAGLLLLAAAALVVPARAQLPTLGDPSDMTVASERKLGEKIARELYRDPDYIDDPVLDEYVLDIWTKLLAAARARGELTPELDDRFAWQVLLGKDRIINAFALPGGWMGVQLGLINVTANRDELAAVLGHELSHVTQRHISRMASEQSKQAPLMIGAMILGAIVAGRNADAGQALIMGGQAATIQGQLNFSRDMEREADRIGMGVMTQAGYDPQAMATMFEKLQQASRLSDNGNYPWLRTHPMTTERIAEAQSRLQLAARSATPPPPDLVHAIVIGRSRVLSNPGVDGLRAYAAEPGKTAPGGDRARQATMFYGAALASAKLREFAPAARYGRQLDAVVAGDAAAVRLATLLHAEIAAAAGDPSKAQALPLNAGRPELIMGSQARLQRGDAAEVVQRLQTWTSLHPRDAQAWQLLSQAYAAQGQSLRAIRADAEAQVAHMDYQAAIDRFRAAQDQARRGNSPADYMEASIIDARARQVQSLLREQALER